MVTPPPKGQKGFEQAFTPDRTLSRTEKAQVGSSFLLKFPDGVATTERNNDQNPSAVLTWTL